MLKEIELRAQTTKLIIEGLLVYNGHIQSFKEKEIFTLIMKRTLVKPSSNYEENVNNMDLNSIAIILY